MFPLYLKGPSEQSPTCVGELPTCSLRDHKDLIMPLIHLMRLVPGAVFSVVADDLGTGLTHCSLFG